MDKYKVVSTHYSIRERFVGKTGEMIGRFRDPSYDDIRLEFEDGEKRWFRFSEVEKVKDNQESDV